MTLTSNIFDQYLVTGNNAITFKLIRKPEDVHDEDIIFHPDMTHQIFGENETIFGYRGLRIDLYFTAGSLQVYLSTSYSSKIDLILSNGVPPDNVEKLLSQKLPENYFTNLDCFLKALTQNQLEEKFKPFGNLKHTYSSESKDGSMRHFEVYSLGYDTEVDALSSAFQKYHEHLQTFLLFFVDGASYIDSTDPFWTYYLIYERYKSGGSSADEPWRYAIAGYMTVYHFYSYPEYKRPRVSQILILPPFQRSGHGQQLLKVFYRDCYSNSKVRDVTVEDPSENFQRMRDFVDCMNCKSLSEFSPEKLQSGFSKTMLETCREKFRINSRQVRRIYEILRLCHTDIDEPKDMRDFRLCVKKRLNAGIMRTSARSRPQVTMNGEGSSGDNNPFSQENRWLSLQKEFEMVMEEYMPVVEKLKKCDS